MQRNFLRGLLICLIPCLVAGFYVAAGFVRWDREHNTLVARQGAGVVAARDHGAGEIVDPGPT